MRLPRVALFLNTTPAVTAILVASMLLQIQPASAATSVDAIPFDIATVSRSTGNSFSLSWRSLGSDSVQVFASPSPTGGHDIRLVGKGGADGNLDVEGLPPQQRWYFTLKPDHGDALTVADRSLHLASAPNFRDIGGLRTTDGRWVRIALLYRSDQLNRVTEPDLATLDRLHLVTIYDFRTERERETGPDKVPSGAHEVVADVLADQKVPTDQDMANPASLKEYAAGGAASFTEVYRHFVSSPTASQAYRAFLSGLADTRTYPAVFHCTGGKDRTGWGAAIVLSALGVPRQVIVDDYMASNRYLEPKNQAILAMMQGHIDPATITALKTIMINRPEYIEAAFDEVEKRYGTMENYIAQGLGIDEATIARLRKVLLTG